MKTIVWVIRAYNGTGGYNYDVGSLQVPQSKVDEVKSFLKYSMEKETYISIEVF